MKPFYGSSIIHQYIYDNRRQLKGIWVAAPLLSDANVINVGWSLCNKKLGDVFDKKRAYNIAIGRACKGSKDFIPVSLKVEYEFFLKRCNRYYKDKIILPYQ